MKGTGQGGLVCMVGRWHSAATARLAVCHPMSTGVTQVRLGSLAKETQQLTFSLFKMPMLPKKMGTPELVPLLPA